jgi:hypothetical protein
MEMTSCPTGAIQDDVDIVLGKELPEKADDRWVMFLESVESQVVSPGKSLVQIVHHNSSVEAASLIEQKVFGVLLHSPAWLLGVGFPDSFSFSLVLAVGMAAGLSPVAAHSHL